MTWNIGHRYRLRLTGGHVYEGVLLYENEVSELGVVLGLQLHGQEGHGGIAAADVTEAVDLGPDVRRKSHRHNAKLARALAEKIFPGGGK